MLPKSFFEFNLLETDKFFCVDYDSYLIIPSTMMVTVYSMLDKTHPIMVAMEILDQMLS